MQFPPEQVVWFVDCVAVGGALAPSPEVGADVEPPAALADVPDPPEIDETDGTQVPTPFTVPQYCPVGHCPCGTPLEVDAAGFPLGLDADALPPLETPVQDAPHVNGPYNSPDVIAPP